MIKIKKISSLSQQEGNFIKKEQKYFYDN